MCIPHLVMNNLIVILQFIRSSMIYLLEVPAVFILLIFPQLR